MYNIMEKVVVAFAIVWAIWSCNAFASQSVQSVWILDRTEEAGKTPTIGARNKCPITILRLVFLIPLL